MTPEERLSAALKNWKKENHYNQHTAAIALYDGWKCSLTDDQKFRNYAYLEQGKRIPHNGFLFHICNKIDANPWTVLYGEDDAPLKKAESEFDENIVDLLYRSDWDTVDHLKFKVMLFNDISNKLSKMTSEEIKDNLYLLYYYKQLKDEINATTEYETCKWQLDGRTLYTEIHTDGTVTFSLDGERRTSCEKR